MNLNEIPVIRTVHQEEPAPFEGRQPQETEEVVDGKYEYEFSLCYDGCLCFVCLYDTSDVSACERIIHRPVKPEEITYSPTTNNGFIVDDGFKYTFTKEPYKRTWKNEVVYENTIGRPQRRHQSAEDILSSL